MQEPVPAPLPFYDLVSVGEILVDLTQVGVNEYGVALYERNPGGAPANLAAAVAKLGLAAAFVGTVGSDPMGAFLIETLRSCGVDTGLACRTDEACTTLAFTTLDPATDGFSYSFVRKPGADQLLRRSDLPALLPQAARVLHLGTLSLTDEPSRGTVLDLAREAQTAGTLVSCDANLRPYAWRSADAMLRETLGLIAHTDLLKVSEEEALLLSNTADLAQATERLLGLGPCLLAITRAQDGALLATSSASAQVEAFSPVEVLDTTGAGDSFWGACLAWLVHEAGVRTQADVERLGAGQLHDCARFGCTAASFTVERPGGMTSSPTAEEVTARLALW